MTNEPEYWYRYENQAFSVIVDAETETFGINRQIVLHKYRVLKHTPRGVWVSRWPWNSEDKVWIKDTRDGPGKRFAYATKKEAMESFIARKARLISILEGKLREAQLYKNNAEYMLHKGLHTFNDRTSVYSHRHLGDMHETSD